MTTRPQVWNDTQRSRVLRDRSAAQPVPETLPVLMSDALVMLLRRWASKDNLRRGRATLLSELNDAASIEQAEELCDLLLHEGWLVRHERLMGGAWAWEAISWRDLPRLQALLGVAGPSKRGEERQARFAEAEEWLHARTEKSAGVAADSTLDPDLLDELVHALAQLREDRMLRLDRLNTRLMLLRAIADWHDTGEQGTRRDFALRAQGTTKSLSHAEWRWLENAFDLERLGIARFAPVAWLAGDLVLSWNGRQVDAGATHFLGLPLDDLCLVSAARGPTRWWLIENRASFERQARQPAPGISLLWLPGRPSAAWLQAVEYLISLAPAPAWISADADPAGVDIACTAGNLWDARGLSWEPYLMEVSQLEAAFQDWPLNAHDRGLLEALLARPALPPTLRALCEAIRKSGRKAEQEGWV